MNSTQPNEHITNIHTVARKGEEEGDVFILTEVHSLLNQAIRENNKTKHLSFIFLYILMSPYPNISHWEGTWMQTSSPSCINDALQIKPFGARSWHFPKQTMKSKDQSLSCSKQEGNCCSKEWLWKWIPATDWQLPNGGLQCDLAVLLTALWVWVGSHALMQMSWPLGSDLGKQSRCWRWLAAGTAGV